MKKLFSIRSNLQTHYHFKPDFQKVAQHTGGKWLIHGPKHHNDDQLQNLEPPVEYPSKGSKHYIKEFEGNMFNPIFNGECPGAETSRGGARLQNQNYLVSVSLKL